MKFTVLGSTGFIGTALTSFLKGKRHEVETPGRSVETLKGKNLGHIIYAIGMTGNFRQHPDAAIEAHVHVLQKLIKDATFDSWLYLSSTRVYGASPDSTAETSPLSVQPGADELYNLSKLLGESICLAHTNPAVRVARLSNVYGDGQSPHTFLGSLMQDLKNTGKTNIQESPNSSKDYVSIEDVCEALESIALKGTERLYNIASGRPVTHGELADIIKSCGYNVSFSDRGATRILPGISIEKLRQEFGKTPRSILDDLPLILNRL